MKARFRVTLGLLLVVAGCAGYYGSAAPRERYGYEYEAVPPSWYGNDPAMRDWYARLILTRITAIDEGSPPFSNFTGAPRAS